ncbi:MAG: epoxyqueuosine reductase QueH [Oscillospiraceae bacterium]
MPNHHRQMLDVMGAVPAGTPLLLHACCGPCASAVLERLCAHFRVTVLYFNPNIAPDAEWQLRRQTLLQLLDQLRPAHPLGYIERAGDEALFLKACAGLETAPEGGARCAACFHLRLEETARHAAALGCEWFCTTLTVSPHKNAALVNEAGQAAAQRFGPRFLPSDFKKQDGYRRSVVLSEQYGLRRQSYCGCRFSWPKEG